MKVQKIKIRSDIQVYRGIAVLSVLLYHIDQEKFTGGYLGVDIFFIISGFVISNLILSRIDAGSFSFKEFYILRFKRIVPSVLSFTIFTWLLLVVFEDTKEIYSTSKGMIYSLFFIVNIYLSRIVDYFNIDAGQNFIINLWSLSVEEQFYIFFPILLFFLKSKTYKYRVTILLVGIICSIIFYNEAVFESFFVFKDIFLTHENFIFYSPITRLWQFIIGAGCMLMSQKRRIVYFMSSSFFSILSIVGIYSITQFPLGYEKTQSSFIVSFLFVILLFINIEFDSKKLSIKPLLFFGSISYSLYLFHQPIFAAIRKYQIYSTTGSLINLNTLSGVSISLFLVLITTLINYQFIENKFRFTNLKNLNIKITTSSLLFLAFSLPFFGVVSSGSSPFNHNNLNQYPENSNLDFLVGTNFIKEDDNLCLGRNVDNVCIFNNKNTLNSIYFVGDSIVGSLISGFVDNENYDNFQLVDLTKGSCPLLIDNCDYFEGSQRLKYMQGIENSIIFIGGNYEKYDFNPNFQLNFRNTIADLSHNNKIYLLNAVPYPGVNVKMYEKFNNKIFTFNYSNFENENSELKKFFKDVGNEKNITTFNIDDLFCTEYCIFQNSEHYWFNDHSHFSYFGSRLVSEYLFSIIINS